MPKTLHGRAFLILFLPVAGMAFVSTLVFHVRHLDKVTSSLAACQADTLVLCAERLRDQGAPRTAETRLLGAGIRLSPPHALPHTRADPFLAEAMENRGFAAWSVEKTRGPQDQEIFLVQAALPQGVLSLTLPRQRLYLRTTDIFLMWYAGSHVLFMGLAWMFMANQIRPLKALARLAEALGRGQTPDPAPLRGAREIRQVARAFTTMRTRLDRFVGERVEMLAAVSHDLGTPLTRMKLALAMMPGNPGVQGLKQDVQDMQAMIQGYLDFVRTGLPGLVQDEPVVSCVESALSGWSSERISLVSLVPREQLFPLPLPGFQRCLQNLVDNGLKWGQHVRVRLRLKSGHLVVHVEDDGPGIPLLHRAHAFQPFWKGDTARNQDKPGTGLGLSIVQDLMHRHGGQVRLGTAPGGGLRVSLRFPGGLRS
jgi:two-component system osmolarity sensor histidine kinase EnvZ